MKPTTRGKSTKFPFREREIRRRLAGPAVGVREQVGETLAREAADGGPTGGAVGGGGASSLPQERGGVLRLTEVPPCPPAAEGRTGPEEGHG